MISIEQETRFLLSRYGIKAKKHLGQNFLVDQDVLNGILGTSNLSCADTVLEIGAGPGILTGRIAEKTKKVYALEIDEGLLKILNARLCGYENVQIIKGDILKTDVASLLRGKTPVKIIANLPYYITTPVIMHLLGQKFPPFTQLLLMVQKEVGLRMAALPGNRDYGIFSIAVQYYTKTELISVVSKKSFFPVPGVDSAIVKMTVLKEPPVRLKDETLFFALVKASFSHRRKTLANSLFKSSMKLSKKEIAVLLECENIEPSRRAESLSLQEFSGLSNTLHKMKINP